MKAHTHRLLTHAFLILGLILALSSIPYSGAVNETHLQRDIAAGTAVDTSALLKLDGFNSPTLLVSNVNKRYLHVGSITNNSNHDLNITITATPDFSKQNNKSYWLGLKIGSTAGEFTYGSIATLQFYLTLSPGQVADVQAALTNNQAREVSTTFKFDAKDSTGIFSLQIDDTARSPRRMTYK